MNKCLKKVLAVSISQALCLFTFSVNAATYEVIEQGTEALVEYTSATSQNDSKLTAISGYSAYNFPVNTTYLTDDFGNIAAFSRENSASFPYLYAELAIGDGSSITANEHAWMVQYLQSLSQNYRYQKVGASVALVKPQDKPAQVLRIFDEKFADTGEYTYSTDDVINGITDQGWLFGSASAPYRRQAFYLKDTNDLVSSEPSYFWLREFKQRGFYSPDNGHTIFTIDPQALVDDDEEQYGGISSIADVNEQNIAVGFVSTGLDDEARAYIDSVEEAEGCQPSENSVVLPPELCIQTLINGEEIFHTQAYKWTLSKNGVISSEPLGTLIDIGESNGGSVAEAINNQGTAVGYATGWTSRSVLVGTSVRSYAVAFKDGNVYDLHDKREDYYQSQAHDINDKGIAVGEASTIIDSAVTTKFFYVDTKLDGNGEMVFPKSFFKSASMRAWAINNNGYIVGDGEVENHNRDSGVPRRKHAFLYKIAEDRLIDLNELLDCDSPYTIVQARGINDANEITANALKREPKRNAKGELLKNINGEYIYDEVSRAVLLKPSLSGDVEQCTNKDELVTRQGASIYWLLLMTLATGLCRWGHFFRLTTSSQP